MTYQTDTRKTRRERRLWSAGALVIAVALAALLIAALMVGCQRETPQARGTTNYGAINQEQVTIITTGAPGAATGTGTTDGYIRGHVYAIHLDYAASLTTTTDVTVSLASPAKTVMYKLNSVTDAWYYPEAQATGGDGAAISGAYDRMPISGRLVVNIGSSTGTTTTTALTATIWWGD